MNKKLFFFDSCMMLLFQEYALSAKDNPQRRFNAYVLGFIVAGFSLVLLLGGKREALIWPMAALGLAAGLLCLIRGAATLPTVQPRTRWGAKLGQSENHWYPPFLFVANHTLGVTFFLLLWDTLTRLGWPRGPLIDTLFFAVLFLVVAKRVTHSRVLNAPAPRIEIMDNLIRFFIVSNAALLVAATLQETVPQLTPGKYDINVQNLLIWLIASLVMAFSALMFFSQLPQHKPDPAKKPTLKAAPVERVAPEKKEPVVY